jgi:ribosome maturation factor RimP
MGQWPIFCFWHSFFYSGGGMREQLIELLEPVVRSQGFELWELEYSPRRGNGLLRLYIDAQAGIDVDDCAKVSRAVSAVLDETDPIADEYTLEVSSPGLDRVLRTAAHFSRYVGERAQVDMVLPVNGRRKFLGKIVSVAGDDLTLDQDGTLVSLSVHGVSKARLAPEF